MNSNKDNPGFNDENLDRDKKLKDGLDGGTSQSNLNYIEEDGSFEIDVKGDDPDYDHPDPYETSAKNGADFDSSYDEANPYNPADEYDADRSLETDVDKLGMHIDDGKIVELDPVDEMLARTPEDNRDDLDEEGYPKNDAEVADDEENNEYL